MINNKYPNFELMEKQVLKSILNNHKEYLGKSYKKSVRYFEQIWPNTATGFDSPGIYSGQAITECFTTVIKIDFGINKDGTKADYYGVFFGEKSAYLVFNPTKQFFKDLENEDLKSKINANKYY